MANIAYLVWEAETLGLVASGVTKHIDKSDLGLQARYDAGKSSEQAAEDIHDELVAGTLTGKKRELKFKAPEHDEYPHKTEDRDERGRTKTRR